jgi:hypothetical protein
MRDPARAVCTSTSTGERRDVIYTLYLHLILRPNLSSQQQSSKESLFRAVTGVGGDSLL